MQTHKPKPAQFGSCAVAECYACSSARRLLVACALSTIVNRKTIKTTDFWNHAEYFFIYFFLREKTAFFFFFLLRETTHCTRLLRWHASLNKKCWWVVLAMVGLPAQGPTDPPSNSLTHHAHPSTTCRSIKKRFLCWHKSLLKKNDPINHDYCRNTAKREEPPTQ